MGSARLRRWSCRRHLGRCLYSRRCARRCPRGLLPGLGFSGVFSMGENCEAQVRPLQTAGEHRAEFVAFVSSPAPVPPAFAAAFGGALQRESTKSFPRGPSALSHLGISGL